MWHMAVSNQQIILLRMLRELFESLQSITHQGGTQTKLTELFFDQ
ncbi:Uncharacterised protein [Vibrio cholerae]|nr:Uncharacterised protein [Vibrio cholerae]CSD88945.1 Uncharacterised protein [Vibrio cholerae]